MSTPGLLVAFASSLMVSYIGFAVAIPALKKAGITGKDLNKPPGPEIPEMGGLVTVAGFCIGILLVVTLNNFAGLFQTVNVLYLLAAVSAVFIAAVIGTIDDLISLRQWLKALAPMVSALPLIAVKAGDSTIGIPFAGQTDLGVLYSLVLVPIGVTVACNGINMLAGFNGLETGMGLISVAALAFIAAHLGETTAVVILLAGAGAMLATIRYNWYPARVFIGDTGTLGIGAIMASAVIIGNFELAGVIVMIPHAVDFFIKARNHFPSNDWWGTYRDGKLYCPEARPRGLVQLIMKLCGGISERNLTLVLMGAEAVCGAVALLLYY